MRRRGIDILINIYRSLHPAKSLTTQIHAENHTSATRSVLRTKVRAVQHARAGDPRVSNVVIRTVFITVYCKVNAVCVGQVLLVDLGAAGEVGGCAGCGGGSRCSGRNGCRGRKRSG